MSMLYIISDVDKSLYRDDNMSMGVQSKEIEQYANKNKLLFSH